MVNCSEVGHRFRARYERAFGLPDQPGDRPQIGIPPAPEVGHTLRLGTRRARATTNLAGAATIAGCSENTDQGIQTEALNG